MDVSVIIVNWNQARLLDDCLQSVFATPSTLRYEVIVVDNGSGDDSAATVRGRYPQVKLICNSANLGFARAQNQALALAAGRYVLALNNDALLHPTTIAALVGFMDRHPEVGCCTCPDDHQTALGSATSGAFRRFPTLARTVAENLWAVCRPPRSWDIAWLIAPLRRWLGEELPGRDFLEASWIVGALLFARREAMQQAGGFDERFFLFDDDIDLCRRLRALGWAVALTTATSFAHDGGGSSVLRDDIERIRGESRALYFQKHHGRAVAMLSRSQHFVLRTCLLSWRRRLEPLLFPATEVPSARRSDGLPERRDARGAQSFPDQAA
jgi:GT2 family glycosyltransferase